MHAGGFADMFTADAGSAVEESQRAASAGEEPAGNAFADMFATPEPDPALPTPHPEPAAGSFGSLFDAPAPEQPELPEVTPVPDAEPSPAGSPAAGAPQSGEADSRATRAVAAVPPSRLAVSRQAAEAATSGRRMTVDPAVADLAVAERYTRADELWPQVERIQASGRGGSTQLTQFVGSAQLTRDHDLDRRQRVRYQEVMEPLLAQAGFVFRNPQDREVLFDMAYDEQLGIGPLGPLWRDDSISEIMVSGPDKVTIERDGRLEHTPVRFMSQAHLDGIVRALAATSKDQRAVSRVHPLVTIQLPGARVQFALAPVAVNRTAIAIRKFGALMDMDKLLSLGALSHEMADFLRDAVLARATLIVSGGTTTGKTTIVNALSGYIPDSERVITIEDALELKLRNTHVESLVTKEAASSDDQVRIGLRDILHAALRMRPDRIIVSEILDAEACRVMLQAANTGHDGTMTTLHANSAVDAIRRMTELVRQNDPMPVDVARTEVTAALDLIVQVTKRNGRRFISEIAQLVRNGEGEADVVTLFKGTYARGLAAPEFSRVASLRPDTDLALRMDEAGVDPTRWE